MNAWDPTELAEILDKLPIGPPAYWGPEGKPRLSALESDAGSLILNERAVCNPATGEKVVVMTPERLDAVYAWKRAVAARQRKRGDFARAWDQARREEPKLFAAAYEGFAKEDITRPEPD